MPFLQRIAAVSHSLKGRVKALTIGISSVFIPSIAMADNSEISYEAGGHAPHVIEEEIIMSNPADNIESTHLIASLGWTRSTLTTASANDIGSLPRSTEKDNASGLDFNIDMDQPDNYVNFSLSHSSFSFPERQGGVFLDPHFDAALSDNIWSVKIGGQRNTRSDYIWTGFDRPDSDFKLSYAYLTAKLLQLNTTAVESSFGLFHVDAFSGELGARAQPISLHDYNNIIGGQLNVSSKINDNTYFSAGILAGKKIPEDVNRLSDVLNRVDFNQPFRFLTIESTVSLRNFLRREVFSTNFFPLVGGQRDLQRDIAQAIPVGITGDLDISAQELTDRVNGLLQELPSLIDDPSLSERFNARLAELGVNNTPAIDRVRSDLVNTAANALSNELEGVQFELNDDILERVEELLRDAQRDVTGLDIIGNGEIVQTLISLIDDIDPEEVVELFGDVNRAKRFLANHLDELGIEDSPRSALIAYFVPFIQARYDFIQEEFVTGFDVQGLFASPIFPEIINHIRATQGEDGVAQFFARLDFDGDVGNAYLNLVGTHLKGGESTFGDETLLSLQAGGEVNLTSVLTTYLDTGITYSDNELGVADAVFDETGLELPGELPSAAKLDLGMKFKAYNTDFILGTRYDAGLILGVQESFYAAAKYCVSTQTCLSTGFERTKSLDEFFGANVPYSTGQEDTSWTVSIAHEF